MNRWTVLGHYIIIQTLTGPPNARVQERFVLQACYTADTNNNNSQTPVYHTIHTMKLVQKGIKTDRL